ncbi:methylated-DNA--[protein]-cysteine S-methyltransferase [Helicobacter mustelae]|uniref:methylated-DNA--[protein]-cysteine S-methyltransferase n=1 Tax=Helicobacter mustelae (strain ATCC 43772 / CCUG 25715 / CIP 103759 / LMG 18044 / NCTC 12198 / R85-136P) TaxID=679897 RepID=D3UFS2_HELM1|nr:methylated-DNA--[protein]-cysteine S-methyltransferase [Helicobacter mustelae]CBG39343.1 methylated-DNA--protein-cysteine methyltransferase [Helicobacter mustelae 12198]
MKYFFEMQDPIYFLPYKTPFGDFYLCSQNDRIIALDTSPLGLLSHTPLLQEASKQLDEYFQKKRKTFCLPLFQRGTPFQNRVWEAIAKIPYGQTRSYKQLAESIAHPRAYRATGSACGKNSLPIFIPCHRVVASTHMGGFALELGIKNFLLKLESQ